MKKNIVLPVLALFGLASTAMADPFYNSNSNVPAAYHPVPPPALPHFYAGVGYGLINVSDEYIGYDLYESTEIDYNALMLQAGYEMNPYVAFEFRYWYSVGDGKYDLLTDIPYPPPAGSYNNMNAWGVYVKPMYPVSQDFSIYALLGMSGVQVDGQPQWGDLVDDIGFSWGLGASFNITPEVSLFADFVQLYDNTYSNYYYDPFYYDPQGTRVHTFNFGITYKF